MSRGRRNQEHIAPSLFPFLAVLLCTMGALVFFLVIIVSKASATSKNVIKEREAKLVQASDEVEMITHEMEAQRRQRQSQIEDQRQVLTHLEDHIGRLLAELEQLVRVSESLETQFSMTEEQRARNTSEKVRLRKQIDDAQTELKKKQAASNNRPPVFAIVPYRGPNGTNRRPIYLECIDKGVVIQPENVLIGVDDLMPPHGPGNPLDAALRLIRNAYQSESQNSTVGQSPYPLLIVRPNGIKSYVLARAAMSAWDDQFGYELVDQAMPLAYPRSEHHLEQPLTQAIQLAHQRQVALLAAMPRKFDAAREWEDEPLSGKQSPSIDVASVGNDWNDAESSATLDGNKWKLIQELPPGSMLSPSDVNQRFASRGNNSAGPRGNGRAPSGPIQSEAKRKLEGIGRNAQSGDWTFGGGGSSSDIAANPVALNDSGSSGLGMNGPNGPTGAGFPATSANRSMSAGGSSTAELAAGNAGSQAANSSSSVGSTASANRGLRGSAASGLSSGNASGMTLKPSDAAEWVNRPEDLPSLSLNVPNQNAGRRSTTGTGQGKDPNDSGSSSSLTPISKSHGRGWAASRSDGRSTPVERPIRFVALHDRWILVSDGRKRTTEKAIDLNLGPAEASDKLAEAIRDRVNSWGLAVSNGYWKPILMIEAAPDAQVSVSRMMHLLEGSGADIQVGPLTNGFITQ